MMQKHNQAVYIFGVWYKCQKLHLWLKVWLESNIFIFFWYRPHKSTTTHIREICFGLKILSHIILGTKHVCLVNIWESDIINFKTVLIF